MIAKAHAPAAIGTAYAACAPHASMAQPAMADPREMPMRMPVIATAIPSVTNALGTRRWASDRLVMSRGAVAEPAMNITTASGQSPSTNSAGTSSRNIPPAARNRRRVIVERKIRVPKRRPAIVDPSAKAPSTMLEKVLVPASSAKATAMTSLPPKIMPVITRAVATSSRPGRRTANPPGRSACGTIGGSVARAARKMSMPAVKRTSARMRPASGNHSVDTSTASTGPSTKDASSATCSKDIAVCSWSGSSRKMWAQRARDIGPGSGSTALRP